VRRRWMRLRYSAAGVKRDRRKFRFKCFAAEFQCGSRGNPAAFFA
jgi:hypothetical protein